MCEMSSCFDMVILTKHLVQNDFNADYETCVFHGEKYTAVEVEESGNDRVGANRMDGMLETIRSEFDLDTEDPPTPKVKEFFRLLKASEEPLHRHMKVTVLAFVTRLMPIKSKFLSNNYYNELLKLIGMSFQILVSYQKTCIIPRNLSRGSVWIEKIDVYENSCMLFWKEHKEENKWLKYGKSRYVEVINDDGETVTTEVAHKQVPYKPIAPRLKWMFLSERT
jgi:hypothetical protein